MLTSAKRDDVIPAGSVTALPHTYAGWYRYSR